MVRTIWLAESNRSIALSPVNILKIKYFPGEFLFKPFDCVLFICSQKNLLKYIFFQAFFYLGYCLFNLDSHWMILVSSFIIRSPEMYSQNFTVIKNIFQIILDHFFRFFIQSDVFTIHFSQSTLIFGCHFIGISLKFPLNDDSLCRFRFCYIAALQNILLGHSIGLFKIIFKCIMCSIYQLLFCI